MLNDCNNDGIDCNNAGHDDDDDEDEDVGI